MTREEREKRLTELKQRQDFYYDADIALLIQLLEQEPKQGHWYRQTNDFVDYYECSECGMAMGLYDVKNYCPNCGSRNEVTE